ncbi:MAG: hypothetical protein ANABAC_0460 [Anaerolineae bacterium]|nr:MAG: hypothetical protein ANABAC_0460 [Anaerolineae bacterium]
MAEIRIKLSTPKNSNGHIQTIHQYWEDEFFKVLNPQPPQVCVEHQD